jgi:hypothetical protein
MSAINNEERQSIAQSKWAIALMAGAAPLALAIAGWAHTIIWDHSSRITILEQKRAMDDIQTQEMKAGIKEQLGEIKDLLKRLDDKLEQDRRSSRQ